MPGPTVTDVGEIEATKSKESAVSSTVPLNPLRLDTAMLEEPENPARIVKSIGLASSAKPGSVTKM